MSGNNKDNKLLLLVLGSLAIICILISYANHNYYRSHFTVMGTTDPAATTNTEMISEKVYQTLMKNQDNQESYDEFLEDLKKEGIQHPKIDMKFYLTAGQAYKNRLLTRAYIVNRLYQ